MNSLSAWTGVLYDASQQVARSLTRTHKAVYLAAKANKAQTTALGESHISSFEGARVLSSAYTANQQHPEAEKLLRKALALIASYQEEFEEPTVILTVALITNLLEQGRAKDTEDLAGKLLVGRADDSDSGLAAIQLLALSVAEQGRFREAEQLQQKLLASCQRNWGEDHVCTAMLKEDLANTYRYQNDLDESANMQFETLD